MQAHEEGGDWKLVAKSLNVHVNTCRGWIQLLESTEPRKQHSGMRRKALTSHIDSLVEWVTGENTVTLTNLRLRLKAVFEFEVSTSTVARYLDGRLITSKKLHAIP